MKQTPNLMPRYLKEKLQSLSTGKVIIQEIPKDSKTFNLPDGIEISFVKDSLGKKSQVRASPNQRFIGYKLKNRFHTYEFAQLPALMNYKYYLNIDVGTELQCDVGTDFFELMKKNPNLQFGFANAPADSRTSTKTLFKNYMKFFKTDVSKRRPDPNNLMDFSVKKLRKTGQLKYSTCNFDSNFEIADLSIFRTDKYKEFFEHFDNAYGQFYEQPCVQ
ncbi:unnamed protein product [Ambrosiozyma monospora]|uniref:Unnamed protein product n=1 Tax=Ambrosiozyma monospora TaxID=43982 RepID=A0ACB5TG50_AMBMO|nr:unnamed protein product [Ambrosiozyma monospora]